MAKRKMYNTTLDANLIKEIRILAAQLEKRQNDLLEEAIQDLLEKYKFKESINYGTITQKKAKFS
jgi:phage anti-repressor protein